MQREYWSDVAKGVAIVLVVYGHATRGLMASGQIPDHAGPWIFFDYLIYTVHMPVFFAISGYFFDASVKKGAARLMRERVKSVVWPYFLWSALHFIAQLVGGRLDLVNEAVEPGRILTILWDPISPFWFLYALAASLFVSGLLRSINPLSIAVVSAALLFAQIHFGAPQIIGDVLYGLVYFSFGRIFRNPIFTSLPPVIVVLSFIAAVLAGFASSLPVRLNFVAGIMGIALFHWMCSHVSKHGALSRGLTGLGIYSMGIFVMHVTVLGAARALGLRLFDGAIPATIVFAVAMAILLPVLVQRLANSLGVAAYLGLLVPSTAAAARSSAVVGQHPAQDIPRTR